MSKNSNINHWIIENLAPPSNRSLANENINQIQLAGGYVIGVPNVSFLGRNEKK